MLSVVGMTYDQPPVSGVPVAGLWIDTSVFASMRSFVIVHIRKGWVDGVDIDREIHWLVVA